MSHAGAGNATMSPPYLDSMDEPAILEALAAQDAAEALIALGWPITPYGDDLDHWQIGDLIWTDNELMVLALRQGVQVLTAPGQALCGRPQ